MSLTIDYKYESEEEEKQTDKKPDKNKRPKKSTKVDAKKFNELLNKEEIGMNRELFKNYLSFQRPTSMLKVVYDTDDKKKNNELINVIKSGLSDLKDDIKEMSDDETEIEKPYKIVDIVEKILELNRQNQEGQGLKTLTPDQTLSRLPITLAELKAGNNREKLKNEIGQLL